MLETLKQYDQPVQVTKPTDETTALLSPQTTSPTDDEDENSNSTASASSAASSSSSSVTSPTNQPELVNSLSEMNVHPGQANAAAMRAMRMIRTMHSMPTIPSSASSSTLSSQSQEKMEVDSIHRKPPTCTTPTTRFRSLSEERFHKNIVGVFNKRGYNVRDTNTYDPAEPETSDSSLSSASSSMMTSIILGLREPNHGQAPLHIAVRKSDVQVIDALLENECVEGIINLQDFNGNTALHFAVGLWRRPDSARIVDRLLEAGADVNIRNNRGLSPIAVHVLTLKIDNDFLVSRLLKHGADANAESDTHTTMLQYAVMREFATVAGALVSYGASMMALNQQGLMVFEAASPNVRCVMLKNIKLAPPFAGAELRSKCMHCRAPIRTSRIKLSNFLRRLLGMRLNQHQHNCYHCGMLYCRKCLRETYVADVLPSTFFRQRCDDLSKAKCCPICQRVMWERKQARVQRSHQHSNQIDNNDSSFGSEMTSLHSVSAQ